MGQRSKNSTESKHISQIVRENPVFFVAFLLFLVAGAASLLTFPTGYWIRWFSDNRTENLNLFFSFFTRMGEAAPYVIGLIILLFVKFRHLLLLPITGLLVTIISFGAKAIFLHDRPSVYYQKLGTFEELNPVEGIRLLTGPTSFPSGHTMSGFAIYGLLAFLLTRAKWLELPLFIFALLVGISRIYLIQHFLKDVYAGAICGVAVAMFIYWIQSKWVLPPTHFLERSLLQQKSKHLA